MTTAITAERDSLVGSKSQKHILFCKERTMMCANRLSFFIQGN